MHLTAHSQGVSLSDMPIAHALSIACWRGGRWIAMTPAVDRDGTRVIAAHDGVNATLTFRPRDGWIAYDLHATADAPTRVRLLLALPGARGAFHLIPGVLHGDNNLPRAEPGHFPNLTLAHPESVSCAPYWEFRADRASHPLSMLLADGAAAGVWIDPYSDAKQQADGFIRNGVCAQLAHDGGADACGVTLGYRNDPVTFINKDDWADASEHALTEARASGGIMLLNAASRLEAHRIVRTVYEQHRDCPTAALSQREAAAALLDALLRINWHDAQGRNAVGGRSGQMSEFFGGGYFREHFTNMRVVDKRTMQLQAWRTLPEIGWTGGGVIGYPLLVAAHTFADATADQRARYVLDLVSQAYRPESGLRWEVCGKHEGKRMNWWWSGYLVQDVHASYVNASAAYYSLKAVRFARDVLGERRDDWLATDLKVLDAMLDLQLPDGGFGFTYSPDEHKVLDTEGFGGSYFVPAMALAHVLTGESKYLESARRGIAYYHAFVRDLNCWGTPLDTWKAVDEEGNLGFIRGARLMHEITGEQQHLDMLVDGANYEYLWRYGFRARPEYPPLKNSPFNSCGGSITSVSNPHIHPMGVNVCDDLKYLATQLAGDDRAYHQARCDDGLQWAANIVSMYPRHTGYGAPGVLSERWCPSDGLVVETFADGSPSSLWFAYNGWAAAAVLEGLVEAGGM